ncbi:MAG: hypothetical protein QOK36_1192, partial [Gaiellales bacterium]|nr:hypothetical protein [Gaiellales bacterium]
MRILHLSHGYPPAVGGSETVICEFSERLVRRGHDVCVVTTTGFNTAAFREPGRATMRAGEEMREGVRVRRHRADPRIAPRVRRAQELAFRLRLPGNGALRTLYDGPLAPGMLRDASREPADVIGATAFPLLHMQFAVAAARARRVPSVLLGALHPDDRWGFDRAPIRRAIGLADAYVAYTGFERDHVERREHVPLACLIEVEQEPHARAAHGGEQRDRLLDRREVRRRRAGDEQVRVGLTAPHEAHRSNEVVDALVAAELADESDQRGPGRYADLLAQRCAVAALHGRGLHAGRDHVDATG